MNYNEKFGHYDKLVKDDIYWNKIGAVNILFIGGCRSFAYAIYFEEICQCIDWFKHAQFGTATIGVHIIDLLKRKKTQNMTYIIENADIIVCEQIRNYDILNTSKKCHQNIFNNFNIKENCKIIQIPNLEFRYYANELIFENNNNINNYDNVNEIKTKNLKIFIENCKKYGFNKFSEYILKNINVSRLMITFNHPTNHLILELFKELIEIIFQQQIPEHILNILSNIKIFDNDLKNRSVICDTDYKLGLNSNVI